MTDQAPNTQCPSCNHATAFHRPNCTAKDYLTKEVCGCSAVENDEQTYALDMNARPCVCGHGSAYHYAADEDETTSSGIVLRRAICHHVEVKSPVYKVDEDISNLPLATITPCVCTSYSKL
jgi:hypothetical protein